MNTPFTSGRAASALVGLLVGGAAGFLLIETVGAVVTFVLGRTPGAGGGGAPPAAFIAVPVLCALAGALIGARRAGRDSRPRDQR